MIPFLLAQVGEAPEPLVAPAPQVRPAPAPAATLLRPQQVAPLPGGLDPVLMVNDNNPELILESGILLSTFEGKGRPFPDAHLNIPLNGRFDLFSHHVYAGTPQTLESTLWLAVVAMPRQAAPVQLRLVSGATSLSQATSPGQASAPFLPLPPLLELVPEQALPLPVLSAYYVKTVNSKLSEQWCKQTLNSFNQCFKSSVNQIPSSWLQLIPTKKSFWL